MRVLFPLTIVILAACTVTVRPLAKNSPHHATGYHAKVHKAKAKTDGQLVDSDWISNYRKLEKDHGDYIISEDKKIAAHGAKFLVPESVIEHYQDLIRAKQSATPTP